MKSISQARPPRLFGWLLIFIMEGVLIAGAVLFLPQAIPPPLDSAVVRLPNVDEALAAQVVDGRPVQALYRLRYQGQQTAGWTVDHYQEAAHHAERVGDAAQSLSYLEAAFSLDPQNTALAIDLAERYIERHDWTRALDSLQQAAALKPDDGWVKTQLGLILAPQDSTAALQFLNTASSWAAYDEPVARLLPILETSADDAGSSVQIGLVFGQAGLWQYAENAFDLAYLRDNQSEYAAYLGLAREMQGVSGQRWIEQAVAESPDSPLVQYVQGIYQRGQRDYPASIDSFTSALALDPLNPAYYVEIGQTYRELGDVITADYWLRQAVTVSNQDPQFERILTDFYAVSSASLSAAGANPNERRDDALLNADAQAEIGWTLYRIGRAADAETAFGVALALEPDNIRVTYYRARIALERGDRDSARQLFEAVIARDSELVQESQALLDLIDSSGE